jgi:hypothetical protein
VLLCVPQFVVILDASVVNVALPSIGHSLRFATADLQWVITAYVLMTGLMLLGDRSADLLGRRAVFLTSLALFTAASLASGLAPTPTALIVSWTGQGVGAAMLSPAALSLITATWSGPAADHRPQRVGRAGRRWRGCRRAPRRRPHVLAGMAVDLLHQRANRRDHHAAGAPHASQRRPRGRHPPRARPSRRTHPHRRAGAARIRDPGIEHLGVGVRPRTVVRLGVAVGLLAAFTALERAAARPLVPPSIWRLRSLTSSATIYAGRHRDPGRNVLPRISVPAGRPRNLTDSNLGCSCCRSSSLTGVASHIGRGLIARLGACATVVSGLALIAAGDLLLSAANANASYFTDFLPGFSLIGFGIGLAFAAITVVAMSDVAAETAALASGLLATGHELAAAFGASLVSAIAFGSGAGGFVTGYGHGALAGAVIAAVLAIVSLAAIPKTRSASGPQLAMH